MSIHFSTTNDNAKYDVYGADIMAQFLQLLQEFSWLTVEQIRNVEQIERSSRQPSDQDN